MSGSVPIGEIYVFEKFYTIDGVAADPTTVRLRVREEIDGTEREWIYAAVAVEGTHFPVGFTSMQKEATGDYFVEYPARKPERVTAVWTSTGSPTDVTEETVFVRRTGIKAIDDPSAF